MELMKGAACAAALTEKIAAEVEELKANGVNPKLAIVRVGERPDDLSYERGALKRMEKCGIETEVYTFPVDITQEEFEKAFVAINDDKKVHGILMFRPLPKSLDEEKIKAIINPLKDVDCMSPANMGKIFMGDKTGYAPCTPEAVVKLIKHYGTDLKGANVALIGRSLVVGKPLSMLLLAENATVTICHTKTKDMADVCSKADVVIAAAGVAKMVDASYIKEGAVVADVGINVDAEGNLCGDVDFDAVADKTEKISPVPGGVGAVTTSVLAEHVIRAARLYLFQ